jgi:hypothetical protein
MDRKQRITFLIQQNQRKREIEKLVDVVYKIFGKRISTESFFEIDFTEDFETKIDGFCLNEQIFELIYSTKDLKMKERLIGTLPKTVLITNNIILSFHTLIESGGVNLDINVLHQTMDIMKSKNLFLAKDNPEVILGHGSNHITGAIKINLDDINFDKIPNFLSVKGMDSHFYKRFFLVEPNLNFGIHIWAEEYYYIVNYWLDKKDISLFN